MTLHPDETIQKALLSTPSRFVGAFEAEGILLTHAWPGFHDSSASMRWLEGPASRSAYIFVFRTEVSEKGLGKSLPDYSPTGDIIAAYLSVLFGKRFDSHGLIEGTGFYHTPDYSQLGTLVNPSLPQNSHQSRPDFGIPLDLSEAVRLTPLLLGAPLPIDFEHAFQGSAKFYFRALQIFEKDPEVAYLHLISAGEILSNFHDFDKLDLLDETTKQYLAYVREGLENGVKVASHFEGRLLLVKKRFVETIVDLVDEKFFERSEVEDGFGAFKVENFRKSIAAAYNLRSKFVHTGAPFGRWVSLRMGGRNNEVQIGKPVVNDRELSNILGHAPTLVGLERVIRYCLFQFAVRHGALVKSENIPDKS